MKTLQTCLTEDKERFLQQLSNAENAEQAASLSADELSRILSLFNEQEIDDALRRKALELVQTIRMTLPLLGCAGKTTIYSRRQYGNNTVKPKKSSWFYIILVLACGCTIASAVIMILFAGSLLKTFNMIIGIALALAAMFLYYLAGRLSLGKAEEQKDDLYAEIRPDAEKIYHTLLAALVTADQSLEDSAREEVLAQKKKLMNQEDVVDQKELELLAGLLESAYAEKNSDYAKEVISDVKYYLHKKKIETVDYSEENRSWFDRMPSSSSGTIRPAFAVDGTLVKKGLAAGGR
ncbi:MAG: hypothetical protein K6A40_11860 [Solobacterium sp.]|nr:hypothetical protein [Solobacterium sp.]